MAIAFNRSLGDKVLTFRKFVTNDPVYPFLLRDDETGSIWDLRGRGIAGDQEDSQLLQLSAHSSFWFARATFWQNSEIYTSE